MTGKGGQGKTSVACATAVALADAGLRTLLVSTDPASNLGEALGLLDGGREGGLAVDGLKGVSTDLKSPTLVFDGLCCANVDPETAATTYRAKAVEALRARGGTAEELAKAAEGLAGQCTVEIAAFDAFAGLLAMPGAERRKNFDIIVFDTAPTGHTLRLLALAWEWSAFFGHNATGASCLGPVEALAAQRATFDAARAALADTARTLLLLVARPEAAALAEARRTAADLSQLGIRGGRLVLNGLFSLQLQGRRADGGGGGDDDDVVVRGQDDLAVAWATKQDRALKEILPSMEADLPVAARVPLRPFNLLGIEALRRLLSGASDDEASIKHLDLPVASPPDELESGALGHLVDRLARGPPKVVMLMGKGGVGKTTLAGALAVGLARRGCAVDLTTTDPAAHVVAAVGHDETSSQAARTRVGAGTLTVDAIDARAATAAYVERIVDAKRREAGAAWTTADEALLREEMDSPCTEELAVFDAFSAKVASGGDNRFVVVDTAPTGHTLLLLDQTGAYQRDVEKYRGEQEAEAAAAATTEAHLQMTPLELLRARATVVVVALPEPTPVSEALALEADLGRAGLAVDGFVINQLIPMTTQDPTLRHRALAQAAQVSRLARRARLTAAPLGVVGVDWSPRDLVGHDALLSLAPCVAPPLRGGAGLRSFADFEAWLAPLKVLVVGDAGAPASASAFSSSSSPGGDDDDPIDDAVIADVAALPSVAEVQRTTSPALRDRLRIPRGARKVALVYKGALDLGCAASARALYALLEPHLAGSEAATTTSHASPPKATLLLPSQVMQETGAGDCCAPGGAG